MVLPNPESLLGPRPAQVRPAKQNDLPDIRNLMAQHEMYGEFLAEECVVAELDSWLCGFARVEIVGEQPYLRPIVVDTQAHGRGVGTALLGYILDQNTSLISISRGSAVGFYARMGFSPVEWGRICDSFKAECQECPDLEDCQPQPMMVVTP